jgi:hypothetical protein
MFLRIGENPVDFLLCVISQKIASGVFIDCIHGNCPLELNDEIEEVVYGKILPSGTS